MVSGSQTVQSTQLGDPSTAQINLPADNATEILRPKRFKRMATAAAVAAVAIATFDTDKLIAQCTHPKRNLIYLFHSSLQTRDLIRVQSSRAMLPS